MDSTKKMMAFLVPFLVKQTTYSKTLKHSKTRKIHGACLINLGHPSLDHSS